MQTIAKILSALIGASAVVAAVVAAAVVAVVVHTNSQAKSVSIIRGLALATVTACKQMLYIHIMYIPYALGLQPKRKPRPTSTTHGVQRVKKLNLHSQT